MKGRMFRSTLVALTLLAAGLPAWGQKTTANPYRWWNVCGGVTTAFNTCASVDIEMLSTGKMQMRVWNRSGDRDAQGNQTATSTVFTAIGFYNIGNVSALATSLTMSGPQRLSSNGSPPSAWQLRNDETVGKKGAINENGNLQVGGGVKLEMAATTANGVDDGIVRDCAPGSQFPGGSTNFWANPCAGYPDWNSNTGWVVFNFDFTGAWGSLATTELLVKGQNGPNGMSTECITGGTKQNCYDVPPPPPPQVVPEPISMTLLGTGLAGVALARRRRRQQQQV